MSGKDNKQTLYLLDIEEFQKANDQERREMVKELLRALWKEAVKDDGESVPGPD